MKETLYTIPVNDAFHAGDECPFCYLERESEQHAVEFILGHASSYMEDDIRMQTDLSGFCRHHYKMMYRFGNHFGSALMLSTHLKKFNQELKEQLDNFAPRKSTWIDHLKKTDPDSPTASLAQWLNEKEESCYICDQFRKTYQRYMDTFFYMYKHDPAFQKTFKESRGFCIHHFKDLLVRGDRQLSTREKEEFFSVLFHLMEENLGRLQKEVTWFCDKHDYLNKDKDWGTSRDSVPRAMQKMGGGYPADDDLKLAP